MNTRFSSHPALDSRSLRSCRRWTAWLAVWLWCAVAAAEPTPSTELAAARPPEPPSEALRVGVAGSSPFVITSGSSFSGLSLEVWREVARREKLQYEFVGCPSVGECIDRAADGALDVVVGPISITSDRARRVRFTQPYFQSSLTVLARPKVVNVWDGIAPFLSRAFVYGLLSLLLVLTVVGTLLWLLERRKNPEHFPERVIPGIGVGIWFALVTMTTVGYGDKAPVTTAGRVATGVWMVFSMLTVSSLTAGIATALTLTHLEKPGVESAEDLIGRPVAAMHRTPGAKFARDRGARVVLTDSIDDAIQRLVRGEVVAVVHDRPVVRYHVSRNFPGEDLVLSKGYYEPQGYGFVVALTNDALMRKLDIALLELAEAGHIDELSDAWLVSGE